MPDEPLTLGEVVAVMDGLWDPRLAGSWDAVGLAVGDPAAPVRKLLLAIDPADAVIDEAVSWGADLVLTHHPLLLRSVHSVAATTPKGRRIHRLVGAGIGLYTAHTNADSADPGVSDALAALLDLRDTHPLVPQPADAMEKIVVFVPEADAQDVLDAMHDAGAGTIGDYRRAAWRTSGTGTFTPGPGASPVVGTVGEAEAVPEIRLETVVPRGHRAAVIEAMRARHPYEEVAFDVYEVASAPGRRGLGRVGELPEPAPFAAIVERLAAALPASPAGLRAAGDPDRIVRRVAVCGGAGDDLFDAARDAAADLYVTADLRHHPTGEALEQGGPVVVDAGHWASEWPWLRQAERQLRAELSALGATVDTRVSIVCTDPWTAHRPTARESGSTR